MTLGGSVVRLVTLGVYSYGYEQLCILSFCISPSSHEYVAWCAAPAKRRCVRKT